MDSRVDQLMREHEQLVGQRGIWEGHWREVAERVRPLQNFFQMIQRSDGDKRTERIFDSTAPLALPKFAAAVISMSFPATQTYHKLTINDEDLKDSSEVKRYLEQLNSSLFKFRYAPHSGFQAQSGEVILDVGAFGTGILFIDDFLGKGTFYKSMPLAQTFIAEDDYGRINTLHRKWQWTAYQAASKFGLENLSEGIRNAFEKEPSRKFWFLHCVKPNPEKILNAKNYKGMDFYSCYIEVEQRRLVSEGGFRVFPFAVPRFETSPNEVYGRGPAMNVLPSIKALNEMKKTILRAAHLQVSPPIMLSDDGALQSFNMRPNALNFGAIDNNGRPMAVPFNNQARVDIGKDLMDEERNAINDAFFVTLFRILVEEPQITATEAMLRAQEKGQLLAPTMGRIQSDLLGPVIEREIDILLQMDAGTGTILPEMPEVLKRHFLEGGEYDLEYQAPLNQAQQAGAGAAILNTLNSIAPLVQIEPNVLLRFDVDKATETLARINGVPESIIRSDEEVAALKEEQVSAQQAQQLLAAAPVAAGAAKDMMQANALAASAPNQMAPDLGI